MSSDMKDVTVQDFLDTLRDAVIHLDSVQPAALRTPLDLWFRATEAQVISERWTHMLGRPIVPIWNAARAVLGEVHGCDGCCRTPEAGAHPAQ